VNPFWEDHVDDVIAAVGVDRVIFGSDWPHIEALPEPLQYVDELAHLSPADEKLILADNAAALNELQPA
jgi:predicted TIM-barrel fold metal-dependent hydrolase